MSCCSELIKAIDRYIAKADDNLADELKIKGYKSTKETVETAEELEEAFSDALRAENKTIVDMISECETAQDFYDKYWPKLKADKKLHKLLENEYKESITSLIKPLIAEYMQDTEPLLTPGPMTNRTSGWIKSWSGQLAELMKLENSEKIESILVNGIDEGKGLGKIIQELRSEGIRDTYAGARRTAITEVLGAHSVAQQEALDLSPSCDRKRWRHTGAGLKPRQNHIDMDGQTVPKDQPYELVGADGGTYHPMYPCDTILPAGERINCHCISEPVVNDDVLGMSLEDRKRLQEKARAEIDSNYEKELDAKNKAKAGINEETIKLDWVRQKSKEGQIKYWGSKSRWALVESGVVTKDSQMFKTVSTPNGKVTVKKTLQELRKSGIITIDKKQINHTMVGVIQENGRMKVGGHSFLINGAELEKRHIVYAVEETYDNGVIRGSIERHRRQIDRKGKHMWFPADWDEDKIIIAGITIANDSSIPLVDGYIKDGYFDNVSVRVLIKENGAIETICPTFEQ